jgi:hypothetical protein
VSALGTNTTTGTGTGGVAAVVGVYDLVPPTLAQYNAGTSTQTNLLMAGTATSVPTTLQPLNGFGVRYKGALVVVVSGATTLGSATALWD